MPYSEMRHHATHGETEDDHLRHTHSVEYSRQIVGELGDLDPTAHPIALAMVAQVGNDHPETAGKRRNDAVKGHRTI